MPICSVEGCNKQQYRIGLCIMHRSRQLRGKDMYAKSRHDLTTEDRFKAK
jgi:hypothetical protein